MKIPIDLILPNPEQPRMDFDPNEISALAKSLRTEGLILPVALEGPCENGMYILRDGERRLRAARLIGWTEIEASVAPPLDDGYDRLETATQRMLTALTANLQRADMRPVDEAMAFQKLIDAGLRIHAIAAHVGKSHSYVRSRLVLLDFPPAVQEHFNNGALPFDMALIGALGRMQPTDQEEVANLAAGRCLSASRIVSMIRRMERGESTGTRKQYGSQEGGRRVDKSQPDSACPPLTKHPLPEEEAGMAELIRKTCLECGLYENGGVRISCPYCALIILARMLAAGEAR